MRIIQRQTDAEIGAIAPFTAFGSVISAGNLGLEIADSLGLLTMHSRVEVETTAGGLLCEVAALKEGAALVLPFGDTGGVRRGARAKFLHGPAAVYPSDAWLGRVVDALGRPIDGKGPLPEGPRPQRLRAAPPPAATRARLGATLDFGVRALNAFTPARAGQRLGVFAAAGVGKSALLGMIARHAASDVNVIALIGERGREVRDFIEDHLGPAGLARSVLVVATSDEPAMMRREAAFLAMALSEHFRDAGAQVFCLLDSLTRVAMAQREIGLAAGEPPATKGYAPSVFSLLPALVERAGPGPEGRDGAVTGVFTVLVEGDDHDEPIADAARAILDGHIVLDRRIAESGRFPAVNIVRSASRAMPGAVSAERAAMIAQVRRLEALHDEMRDMIRIGAYRAGADPEVDRAIDLHKDLERFLGQSIEDASPADAAFEELTQLLKKDAS